MACGGGDIWDSTEAWVSEMDLFNLQSSLFYSPWDDLRCWGNFIQPGDWIGGRTTLCPPPDFPDAYIVSVRPNSIVSLCPFCDGNPVADLNHINTMEHKIRVKTACTGKGLDREPPLLDEYGVPEVTELALNPFPTIWRKHFKGVAQNKLPELTAGEEFGWLPDWLLFGHQYAPHIVKADYFFQRISSKLKRFSRPSPPPNLLTSDGPHAPPWCHRRGEQLSLDQEGRACVSCSNAKADISPPPGLPDQNRLVLMCTAAIDDTSTRKAGLVGWSHILLKPDHGTLQGKRGDGGIGEDMAIFFTPRMGHLLSLTLGLRQAKTAIQSGCFTPVSTFELYGTDFLSLLYMVKADEPPEYLTKLAGYARLAWQGLLSELHDNKNNWSVYSILPNGNGLMEAQTSIAEQQLCAAREITYFPNHFNRGFVHGPSKFPQDLLGALHYASSVLTAPM